MGEAKKSVFALIFECAAGDEDLYEVILEKISDEIYTDGNRFFIFTESFVYVLEADEKGSKKKIIAKRKGKNLVLSGTKDEIVFSPDAILRNTTSYF